MRHLVLTVEGRGRGFSQFLVFPPKVNSSPQPIPPAPAVAQKTAIVADKENKIKKGGLR
jgi:hypothetical protein